MLLPHVPNFRDLKEFLSSQKIETYGYPYILFQACTTMSKNLPKFRDLTEFFPSQKKSLKSQVVVSTYLHSLVALVVPMYHSIFQRVSKGTTYVIHNNLEAPLNQNSYWSHCVHMTFCFYSTLKS